MAGKRPAVTNQAAAERRQQADENEAGGAECQEDQEKQ